MKKTFNILPISDVHSDIDLVKEICAKFKGKKIDFVTISGDILEKGSDYNLTIFKIILNAFKNCKIVFISGNHDYHQYSNLIKMAGLQDQVIYLENEVKVIDGLKFYGSPLSTPFYDWNYMKPDEQIKQILDCTMEHGIDIALFHQPPFGHGDIVTQRFVTGEHLGSHAILKAIDTFMPRYAFYGHLHTGDHTLQNINEVTQGQNVACLDEYYAGDIQHLQIIKIKAAQ